MRRFCFLPCMCSRLLRSRLLQAVLLVLQAASFRKMLAFFHFTSSLIPLLGYYFCFSTSFCDFPTSVQERSVRASRHFHCAIPRAVGAPFFMPYYSEVFHCSISPCRVFSGYSDAYGYLFDFQRQ